MSVRGPLALVLLLTACGGGAPAPEGAKPGAAPAAERVLTLGAYTTPREVLNTEILPKFSEKWKADHKEPLRFETSYQGSGAQARAIVGGFEADVAALSLEPDIEVIRKAGLITTPAAELPQNGIVTTSIVVFAVRKGNPKGIKDWSDLARADVDVLTPNVKTSGGAMWNVAALYGAALRGKAGVPGDEASAAKLLKDVIGRVKVMDKGGRESMTTFDQGVGDVAITYENEVIAAQLAGKDIEEVVPSSTLLIEMPVAVIDGNTGRHGNAAAASEFVKFLFAPESQASFVKFGFRTVTGPAPAGRPNAADTFTIRDLGGWPAVQEKVFGPGGVYDTAVGGAPTP